MRRLLPKMKILVLATGICFACKQQSDDGKKMQPPMPQAQNIVILLDLSSRIFLENQVKRDSNLIASVVDAFEKNQIKYRFQISNDKLSLATAYQNSSTSSDFSISGNMIIDMAMRKPRMNKPVFNTRKKAFLEAKDSIYADAIKDKTTGADIWGYFCNDLNNTLVKGAKNKIIILTDGYLQFNRNIQQVRPRGTYMSDLSLLRNKSKWESIFDSKKMKLTPCSNSFSEDIEVLILEIAPKNKHLFTNEFQIIEKYWKTWFQDMGIVCAGIYQTSYYQATSEGSLQTKISEFLKE